MIRNDQEWKIGGKVERSRTALAKAGDTGGSPRQKAREGSASDFAPASRQGDEGRTGSDFPQIEEFST